MQIVPFDYSKLKKKKTFYIQISLKKKIIALLYARACPNTFNENIH